MQALTTVFTLLYLGVCYAVPAGRLPICRSDDISAMWPDYTTVTKYYQCVGVGSSVLLGCPRELQFSFYHQACVSLDQWAPPPPEISSPPTPAPKNQPPVAPNNQNGIPSPATPEPTLPTPSIPRATTVPKPGQKPDDPEVQVNYPAQPPVAGNQPPNGPPDAAPVIKPSGPAIPKTPPAPVAPQSPAVLESAAVKKEAVAATTKSKTPVKTPTKASKATTKSTNSKAKATTKAASKVPTKAAAKTPKKV